ncbi:VOC family protein [Rhodococcus sp. NPDC003382]
MKAEDLFHLGIVADDPEATREEFTALFGYEWGPEVGGAVPVTLPAGDRTVELRCAYSITEPRLEVVRSVPGTLWEAGGGIHHAGYWSDDVAADAAALVARGFVTEATRAGADGDLFFAFLRGTTGLRIELVTRVAEQGLQQCWGAGA